MAQASPGNEAAALDALERGYDERSDWMYTVFQSSGHAAMNSRVRLMHSGKGNTDALPGAR